MRIVKKMIGLILLLLPVFKYVSEWKKEEDRRKLIGR